MVPFIGNILPTLPGYSGWCQPKRRAERRAAVARTHQLKSIRRRLFVIGKELDDLIRAAASYTKA